jgi:hypothetical protein
LVYSPVIAETVAVRPSFICAVLTGWVSRFFGTVAPAEVGAQVGFQLLRPGKSINEGGTVVSNLARQPWGVSLAGCVFVTALLYRALIKVLDGGHVSNYSEPILVR